MDYQVFYQLFLAAILGGLIGLERETKKKEAGLRTHSLVSLSVCLFTIISFELFYLFSSQPGISFDPSRIIQAIAVGIGFIGAGVIFRRESGILGLTSAACLLMTSAIGMTVGIKLYSLAVFSTFLTLLLLFAFGLLERRFLDK